MICIHHNKDLDGFSSGAIVKLKYPDCKLIGWDYKDEIPDFEQFRGEDIIMIDISFPTNKILELKEVCNHITIIDHHISFAKDFYRDILKNSYSETMTECEHIEEKIHYVYKLKKAACEIGWEYLFPDKPVPYAITLLGRYDTWRQNEGDWKRETLPFQYSMRNQCTSPETFSSEFFDFQEEDDEITDCIIEGISILNYQEQQDRLACERSAFEKNVYGLRGICLNTRAFSSNTLKSVYNKEKHDIMVGFEYTGSKWSVSLRSVGDVDCSTIAKERNGGGHKNAAGFEVENFEDIFK